jgi:hypothetical protein
LFVAEERGSVFAVQSAAQPIDNYRAGFHADAGAS